MRTAVAGDAPPLMGLPCLTELPSRTPSRVLVPGSLFAVPPATRYSVHGTVRDRGPGCSHRLGRPTGYDPAVLAVSAEAERRPSWDFVPLQRSRPAGVRLIPEIPTSGTFRPRRFTRPRRVPPPTGFRPFSGRCRSWGSPYRALLLVAQPYASRRRYPPAVPRNRGPPL
jgi:hypothetical protein